MGPTVPLEGMKFAVVSMFEQPGHAMPMALHVYVRGTVELLQMV
jgi:hypothetical protein